MSDPTSPYSQKLVLAIDEESRAYALNQAISTHLRNAADAMLNADNRKVKDEIFQAIKTAAQLQSRLIDLLRNQEDK